jgi:hypothetical protein
MSETFITPEFRCAYVFIHNPARITQGAKAGQFERRMQAVFENKEDGKPLLAMFKKWLKTQHPEETMESLIEEGYAIPFKTKHKRSDIEKNPYLANAMTINLKWNRDFPPTVIDKKTGKEILTAADFYSGCYAQAEVSFYEYDYMGKQGFSVGIQNILKTDDGERMGGGAPQPALQAFAGMLDVDNDDEFNDDGI